MILFGLSIQSVFDNEKRRDKGERKRGRREGKPRESIPERE